MRDSIFSGPEGACVIARRAGAGLLCVHTGTHMWPVAGGGTAGLTPAESKLNYGASVPPKTCHASRDLATRLSVM